MAQGTHATPPTQVASAGTAYWQSQATAQHQAERSAYLDQVFATPLVQDIADRTLELLALAPGQAVLEVGCGGGVFLPLLARAVGPNGRVVGLDHAPAFVAEAQARVADAGLAGTVTVEEGDACHLPYPDANFDAAHCERVLQHLADPDAALRELARVVRPGGWVVVTDTDWPGIRLDHPDRAGCDLLWQRSLTGAQPDMGLTLYRRLADAGLADRRVRLVQAMITALAVWRTYIADLRPTAEALVAEGLLTRGRAEDLLTYLDTADQDGRFYGCGVLHIVAGRRPAPDAHPDAH